MNLLTLLLGLLIAASAQAQAPPYNLGRTPTDEEIKAWSISIGPEGKELPPGRGTAKEGRTLYAAKCAQCHGPTGKEGSPAANGLRPVPALVGGIGTLNTAHPIRTVGSYWPFATTIWDYINRAMPLSKEGSLNPDEVYALTAFVLYGNGIVQENDVIDAERLPKIEMPNRNGFIPARPEWKRTSSK